MSNMYPNADTAPPINTAAPLYCFKVTYEGGGMYGEPVTEVLMGTGLANVIFAAYETARAMSHTRLAVWEYQPSVVDGDGNATLPWTSACLYETNMALVPIHPTLTDIREHLMFRYTHPAFKPVANWERKEWSE